MLKKLVIACLFCTCLFGFNVGCSQGPGEVQIDKSLKDQKLGGPAGEQPSEHSGGQKVD